MKHQIQLQILCAALAPLSSPSVGHPVAAADKEDSLQGNAEPEMCCCHTSDLLLMKTGKGTTETLDVGFFSLNKSSSFLNKVLVQ